MARKQKNEPADSFLIGVGVLTCIGIVTTIIALIIITGVKVWTIADGVSELQARPSGESHVYVIPPGGILGGNNNTFKMPQEQKESF